MVLYNIRHTLGMLSKVYQVNICGRGKIENFISTSTGTECKMKHFMTCATRYIVYLITCPCGKQYVGRSIQTFSTKVHLTSIKKGKTNQCPEALL